MGDKMEDAGRESGDLFRFFVIQNQMTAMIYLGKVVHPATGKIERNLDGARFSIDLLGMLEEKTRGNLTAEESKLLEQTLTNLRLNYVDEVRREKETAGGAEGGEKAAETTAEKTGKTEHEDEGERASDPGA
jgi:hypothetical protein